MLETRSRFHDELAALESEIVGLGERAKRALERSVGALFRRDVALAKAVIDGDDEIDATYLHIEERILALLATQTPVASDLRLVSAIIHLNLHLERVGDLAVNIAKVAIMALDLPTDPTMVSHLQEMGSVTTSMLQTAMEAFSRRDAQLAESLSDMDEPVDRLNRNMYIEVVRLGVDPRRLEWGVQMNFISRQLERVGDHAVDIGEQVAFLLTGQFREFTDASHPELEMS
jgi:phosphate transport system protein